MIDDLKAMEATEKENSSDKIPFSIDDPEFDMNKFSGRFNSFLKVSNPRHAFYSNNKIRSFQKLLDDQREKEKQQMAKLGTKTVMLTEKEIKQIRVA